MTAEAEEKVSIRKMLVIDDETELRILLATKFSRAGFSVDVAAGSIDAEAMITCTDYDVVLCDLNLHENLEGQKIFNVVRKKSPTSKFIAITGFAQDSPEVRSARDAGIPYVFSKPLRLKSLLEIINQSA